jgi:hypothetical protein
MGTILCHHCGRKVSPNKKLKHIEQHYCGNIDCQHSRKLAYERNKYQNNQDYRVNKLDKNGKWRKKRSGRDNPQYHSEYQRAYRASHPGYVLQNKIKQRERYARKKGQTSFTTKIVNPDALMLQPADNERVYAMFSIDCKKIVNPDTLMLERIDKLPFTNNKPMFVRLL